MTALFFLNLLIIQYATCLDYDGWLNIKIDHSINCKGEKFCNRGNVSLKSIRAGNALIDQIPFTTEHIDELKNIAALDGFYTLRTLVTTADSKETEFLSSIKAQAFLQNALSDVISAWVMPNGEVIAVTFQVSNSSHSILLEKEAEYNLSSNFYLRYVDQAPVEAREKGELKDNRSFLAKYWMYIVPIAIFVMISGASNPEGAAPASR
ncbi:unnamed protein product [Leptidea sinapis]|uniref:ER membrane protein complex subunit 10 n=1 Tax=Leptidea sinapis TaxID=189913 RepID=A0A5E4PQT2_9NEOP|nr:unnamed protein product [Leptidea sinapis]